MSETKINSMYGVPCQDRDPKTLSPRELATEIKKVAGIIVRAEYDAADDHVNPAAYRREVGSFLTDGRLAPLLHEALRRNGDDVTALVPNTQGHPKLPGQLATYLDAHTTRPAKSVGIEVEFDLAKGLTGLSTEALEERINLARFSILLRHVAQNNALHQFTPTGKAN
jgi:hypothetical protein